MNRIGWMQDLVNTEEALSSQDVTFGSKAAQGVNLKSDYKLEDCKKPGWHMDRRL